MYNYDEHNPKNIFYNNKSWGFVRVHGISGHIDYIYNEGGSNISGSSEDTEGNYLFSFRPSPCMNLHMAFNEGTWVDRYLTVTEGNITDLNMLSDGTTDNKCKSNNELEK